MQHLKNALVNRLFDHYLLVVILFYILMVFMYGIINYNIPPYKQWDLMHYLNMSSLNQVNTTDIEAPFCFRILGPSLSKLLGKMIGSNMQAFRFLTIFFGFCCVLLFYYFFIFMKIKPIISMVSTLMFMFNKYYFGFVMWNYFQLNCLLSMCCLIILFWSMYKNQWLIYGITFVIGCLSRETVIIMLPVTLCYLFEKKASLLKIKCFFYSVLPGIVCFIWIRLTIESVNDYQYLASFGDNMMLNMSLEAWMRKILLSVFPLSLIWILCIKDSIDYLRGKMYIIIYILLVLFSTMFGLNHERLMNPMFIVFYWFLAVILQKYNIISFSKILLLLSIGFLSSFHHEMGRYIFFGRDVYIYSVIFFTFIITFLFYYWQHNKVLNLTLFK